MKLSERGPQYHCLGWHQQPWMLEAVLSLSEV